ncbi:hypothetical protein NL676_009167 [Syzygium grande]|nr:hypothetical protein NL676_009167 [Syzygium grande]
MLLGKASPDHVTTALISEANADVEKLSIPTHAYKTCANDRINHRSGVAESPPSSESSLLEYRKQVREDVERTGHEVGLLPHFRLTKRKRDHRLGSSRTRTSGPFRDEREGEEMNRAGVDTVLRLREDPCKIRKVLTASDVDHSSRLLLQKGCVETHVLPWMREEMVRRVKSRDGMEVAMWDEDTRSEHRLMFCYRALRSYELNRGWKMLFVNRRRLEVGDEIGMYWNTVNDKFHFTVLRRVARDLRLSSREDSAKEVLLGDFGAGKSSLVLRFVKGQFVEFKESTIGAAFFSQTLAVNDATVKFEIWDTAGQERYHSLAPMYYRGAAAAIIASFERAKKWVQELQAQGNPNIIVALAGNKADLLDARKVTAEEAQTYAQEHGLFFIETSAKTATNVDDIFYEIDTACCELCN